MSANIKTNHKKHSVLFGIVFLSCFYFKKLPVSIKPHACFLVLTLNTLNSLSSQLLLVSNLFEYDLDLTFKCLGSSLGETEYLKLVLALPPSASNQALSELSSLRIKSCPDLHLLQIWSQITPSFKL